MLVNWQDQEKRKKYDLIIHDVFDQKGAIAELNTIPFYNNLRTLVETSKVDAYENGIVAANYWTVNLEDLRDVVARYESVFSYVRVYGVGAKAFEQNCIIIAHSPKADNNWKCADKLCEKKKGKKKSKKSSNGICASSSKLAARAAAIQAGTPDMSIDLEESFEDYWESRPLKEDSNLC